MLRLETGMEFDELKSDPSASELYFRIDEAEAQRRLERLCLKRTQNPSLPCEPICLHELPLRIWVLKQIGKNWRRLPLRRGWLCCPLHLNGAPNHKPLAPFARWSG